MSDRQKILHVVIDLICLPMYVKRQQPSSNYLFMLPLHLFSPSRFINAFRIGPNAVQVGVVSFSNDDVVNFYLNDYDNKADLIGAIFNIEQIGGQSRLNSYLFIV